MNCIADTHSHHLKPDAIVDINGNNILPQGFVGSAGIHPWHTSEKIDWDNLKLLISASHIVAIGECGLDSLHGADITTQKQIFERHIELSEALGKPLIIHCVRAHQILLEMHHNIKPSQEWILHGFRLRPSIAASLLNEGINLSFGEHFNAKSVTITPAERLFLETDESNLEIEEIAQKIGNAVNIEPDYIVNNSVENIKRACRL